MLTHLHRGLPQSFCQGILCKLRLVIILHEVLHLLEGCLTELACIRLQIWPSRYLNVNVLESWIVLLEPHECISDFAPPHSIYSDTLSTSANQLVCFSSCAFWLWLCTMLHGGIMLNTRDDTICTFWLLRAALRIATIWLLLLLLRRWLLLLWLRLPRLYNDTQKTLIFWPEDKTLKCH